MKIIIFTILSLCTIPLFVNSSSSQSSSSSTGTPKTMEPLSIPQDPLDRVNFFFGDVGLELSPSEKELLISRKKEDLTALAEEFIKNISTPILTEAELIQKSVLGEGTLEIGATKQPAQKRAEEIKNQYNREYKELMDPKRKPRATRADLATLKKRYAGMSKGFGNNLDASHAALIQANAVKFDRNSAPLAEKYDELSVPFRERLKQLVEESTAFSPEKGLGALIINNLTTS